MREIKFRAWMKKENKYLHWFEMYGLSRYDDNKLGVHVGIADQCYLDPDEMILEQYAELKDKNGKEIYEGDIVTCNGYEGCSFIVSFSESAFRFQLNTKNNSNYRKDVLSQKTMDKLGYVIIGNTHENKNLLEKTNERY